MTKPFTYRLTWTSMNVNYYGVKFAKNCNPSDLWKTYFTSNNAVKAFIKMYGDPDVVEVRKVFTDKITACKWETRVLKRLKVKKRADWLNQSENIGFLGMPFKTGRPKGSVTMRNIETGELISVHVNDERIKNGILEHPTKGTKTVFDTITNRCVRVSLNENSSRYQSINKGFRVVVEKSSSTNIRIQLSEFDPEIHTSLPVHNRSWSDDRRKNQSKNFLGENNPMYGKTGTFKGKKHSEETIQKIKESIQKGRGENWINPQLGVPKPTNKRWYHNGFESILIEPENAPPGFTPGRASRKKYVQLEELTTS